MPSLTTDSINFNFLQVFAINGKYFYIHHPTFARQNPKDYCFVGKNTKFLAEKCGDLVFFGALFLLPGAPSP